MKLAARKPHQKGEPVHTDNMDYLAENKSLAVDTFGGC
jgi:hypothetical protein